jgi:hypothetical protein
MAGIKKSLQMKNYAGRFQPIDIIISQLLAEFKQHFYRYVPRNTQFMAGMNRHGMKYQF